MRIGNYQRHLLRTAKSIQGGQLVKGTRGNWYIHVWCEFDDPAVIGPNGFLGVDLGIAQLATDSDGNQYSGADIEAARVRVAKLRAALQSKGTKSAKRHLKRLADKEARFRRDVNHKISFRVVQTAKRTGRGIKLEELSGIRERVKVKRGQRAKHHGWAFDQLREFVTYKCVRHGVALATVDPAYTSRECSECGCREKGNRPNQSAFRCLACGYCDHVDRNAARNISRADVLQPIVGTIEWFASAVTHSFNPVTDKPRNSFRGS
jgi:putative transposase